MLSSALSFGEKVYVRAFSLKRRGNLKKIKKKDLTEFLRKVSYNLTEQKLALKVYVAVNLKENTNPRPGRRLFFVPSPFKLSFFTSIFSEALLSGTLRAFKNIEKRKRPNNFSDTLLNANAKLWCVRDLKKALKSLLRLVREKLEICIEECHKHRNSPDTRE